MAHCCGATRMAHCCGATAARGWDAAALDAALRHSSALLAPLCETHPLPPP
eukprot:gene55413-15831_t